MHMAPGPEAKPVQPTEATQEPVEKKAASSFEEMRSREGMERPQEAADGKARQAAQAAERAKTRLQTSNVSPAAAKEAYGNAGLTVREEKGPEQSESPQWTPEASEEFVRVFGKEESAAIEELGNQLDMRIIIGPAIAYFNVHPENIKVVKSLAEKIAAASPDVQSATLDMIRGVDVRLDPKIEEDVTRLMSSMTEEERQTMRDLFAMYESQSPKDGTEKPDEKKQDLERQQIVEKAQAELKGINFKEMGMADRDIKIGQLMVKHGVSVDVSEDGGTVNVMAPQTKSEEILYKIMGFFLFIKGFVDKFNKKNPMPEKKKEEVPLSEAERKQASEERVKKELDSGKKPDALKTELTVKRDAAVQKLNGPNGYEKRYQQVEDKKKDNERKKAELDNKLGKATTEEERVGIQKEITTLDTEFAQIEQEAKQLLQDVKDSRKIAEEANDDLKTLEEKYLKPTSQPAAAPAAQPAAAPGTTPAEQPKAPAAVPSSQPQAAPTQAAPPPAQEAKPAVQQTGASAPEGKK